MKKISLNIIFILITYFFLLPVENSFSLSVKHQYFKAEKKYKELMQNPSKRRYRTNWTNCINLFEKAWKQDPKDPWAPASMYKAGYLYFELADVSFSRNDIFSGIARMDKLIKTYPKSRYKYRAIKAIKDNKPKLSSSLYKNSKRYTTPQKKPAAKKANPKVKKNPPKKTISKTTGYKGKNNLTGIRFSTQNNRTRIVVDTQHEVKYQFNDLNRDGKNNKPARIYIDFNNLSVSDKIKKNYVVTDTQVKNIRLGQRDKKTLRLVIDLEKNAKDFKVFSLFKPYRTVIDIWGGTKGGSKVKNHPAVSKKLVPEVKKNIPGSLIKQLALGVNKIVIDPGHGGKDYGAPGYLKGVHEKQITLSISKMLAQKIKKELGYEVLMTRKTDKYLSLEQRTSIANRNKADLFISIHTNSARNRKAYGIETYFLNLATDEDSISVAARENATSTKNISDLQTILNDLMRDAKINESSRLATYVQNGMTSSLRKKYKYIKDRGVRQAPFYVLLGARMPAVLVEVSFISNSRECKRLKKKSYQEKICDGIMTGIKRYISETGAKAAFRVPEVSKKS